MNLMPHSGTLIGSESKCLVSLVQILVFSRLSQSRLLSNTFTGLGQVMFASLKMRTGG